MAVVSAAGKHGAPAAFDEPIYVTRPLLPDLRVYVAALEGIWQRRWLTNKGELHDTLERTLCEHLRVRHLSLVANGTAALMLAYRAFELTGEVITTPFTSPATVNALTWCGLTPVFADINPVTLTLDPVAIEAAITPRTRIVVINTPHNPTGVIYSRERLAGLAAMLMRKSAQMGRPIFILSDEPYRRIRFDGAAFTSPAAVYPHTLIDYSYGKILLAPGLRVGYLALSPAMPEADRLALRAAAVTSQVGGGWNFPDAPLQYAVGDLERIGIDIGALQRKRDRLHGALTEWGYRMTRPAGTFYLWGRAPGGHSERFTRRLADQGVFVMPGTLFDRPADFRISLTGTEAMIEASLPAFEAAAER